MTDSFMHEHQSALDSQREDDAIQYLQDTGVYPNPDNDDILERLYEEELEWFMNNRPKNSTLQQVENSARYYARKRFEELPDPVETDYEF